MGSYTQLLYQIVFCAKHRKKVMIKPGREKLYNYIAGILWEKKCHPYKINGVSDHLHIITDIHPSVAIADLVKDIKLATSKKIKEEKWFPGFSYWQEGYSVFSYSIEAKENLIKYVANQEVHHNEVTSLEEIKSLLIENKIDFDEKYLE